MKILILEDDPVRQKAFKAWLNPDHDVYIVATAQECIAHLDTPIDGRIWKMFNVLFLDHDLGGEQNVPSGPGTGYEVAQWLVDHPDKIPGQVIVHSMNPVGNSNIVQLISRVFPGVESAPGCWVRG